MNLLSIFTPQQEFCFGKQHLSSGVVISGSQINKNEAWIEIKEVLLKHFLPDNHSKLVLIRQQLVKLKETISNLETEYENSLLARSDEAHMLDRINYIRKVNERLRSAHEEYHSYNTAFHGIINEHPLLASYSNIFVILFASLKELSKMTGEVTYSWKIYMKLLDMIIAKIIRDLTMNLKQKEEESDSEEEGEGDEVEDMHYSDRPKRKKKRSEKKKEREFTIDEEFFHSVIMPSIYSTVVAGLKQENIALFNLIFALEIALKKTTMTPEDKAFFLGNMLKLPNYKDWRS
jgi:hypothetical protein